MDRCSECKWTTSVTHPSPHNINTLCNLSFSIVALSTQSRGPRLRPRYRRHYRVHGIAQALQPHTPPCMDGPRFPHDRVRCAFRLRFIPIFYHRFSSTSTSSFALLGPRDSRAEFSFWALWSAPLIVTSDVRDLFGHRKEILTNPEVIAVNQDALATAGDRVSFNNETGAQVWSKPLANGDIAVLLFNSHDRHTIDVSCSWQQFGIAISALVRDLWLRTDLGRIEAGFSAKLAPHDVKFLRLTPAG